MIALLHVLRWFWIKYDLIETMFHKHELVDDNGGYYTFQKTSLVALKSLDLQQVERYSTLEIRLKHLRSLKLN